MKIKDYHLQIVSSVFANLASGWYFIAIGAINNQEALLFNLLFGTLALVASFKFFSFSKKHE
jgi:hypothetical protein